VIPEISFKGGGGAEGWGKEEGAASWLIMLGRGVHPWLHEWNKQH